MSLKKAAFSGMIWVFADTFIVKGISFIGSIVLARLLVPSDFGLIAMISIFVAIGTVLLDSGLSSSLIRNVNNDERDYSTIFYVNIIFSIILYIIFFLAAPFIAKFYNQTILISLIRVYCLSFFIAALTSVQMTILIKQMEFKKIAIANIPGVIIGSIVGILMGYNGFGVWSIAAMYLANQFMLFIFLWLSSEWKPKLIFSKDKFAYHYNFGYKLFISSLIGSIFGNIYNVVIGKFYSLNTTGNFERGSMFNQYPVIVLSQIIGKVTFPLLANIQGDKERLRTIFIRLVDFTFFVTAPVMIVLSACAAPLILVILGEKWSGVIPIFSVLCFGGLFYTLQALNVNIMKIYGRSDYILKGEIFLKIISISIVICATLISFNFLLWSIVLNSFLTLMVHMYYCRKTLCLPMKDQLRSMFPILIISLLTFSFIKILLIFISGKVVMLLELFIGFFFGIISYLLLSYIFKIPTMLTGIEWLRDNKIMKLRK